MKKIKIWSYVWMLFLPILFAACEKEESNTPEPPVEDVKFAFNVQESEETSVRISVVPTVASASYYWGIIEKSLYTYDSELANANMELMKQEAEAQGVTLEEVIARKTCQGSQDQLFENLKVATTYWVYAYTLQPDGTAGKIFKQEFSTAGLFKLEIESVLATKVNIVVYPEDPEMVYYIHAVEKGRIDKHESDQAFLDQYIQENYGFMKFYMTKGEYHGSIEQLYPKSEYYIVLFGYDHENRKNTTALYKYELTTPDFSGEFTVEFDISSLTATRVAGTTKPSIPQLRYARGVISKAEYEKQGAGYEVIKSKLDSIVNKLSNGGEIPLDQALGEYAGTGNRPFAASNLSPETDYYLWNAVINNNANILMEPYLVPFRTTKHEEGVGKIELDYQKFYDGNDYYADDPMKGRNYKDKFVLQLRLYGKTDDVVKWFVKIAGGDLSSLSEEELIGLAESGRQNPTYDKVVTMYEPWSLVEDKGNKCTILVIGADKDNRFTPLVKQVVDLDKSKKSDIQEFYDLKGITIK